MTPTLVNSKGGEGVKNLLIEKWMSLSRGSRMQAIVLGPPAKIKIIILHKF